MYATLTLVLIIDALLATCLAGLPLLMLALSLFIGASWAHYAFKCAIFFAELYPVCSNAIAILVITPYRRRVARAFAHFRHSITQPIPLHGV